MYGFAESEVVSPMAEGLPGSHCIRAFTFRMQQTYSLVSRIGVENIVFFSGGVSRNKKLGKLLSDKLGVEVISSDESQFIGAIGAAIIGYK